MRTSRSRWWLVALAGWCGAMSLCASPAAADVDCSDLGTRSTAQTYFDGRAGDPDRLDADADGRACEHNDPSSQDGWTMIALGTLLAAGLLRAAVGDRRSASPVGPTPPEGVLVPAQATGPAEVAVAAPVEAPVGAPVGHKQRLVSAGRVGSVGELARALRVLSYADRMPLLEEHAHTHRTSPQGVLDDLVAHTGDDLELQGWALAGYGPPSSVRLGHCSCVGAVRNFRLSVDPDGSRSWSCATCRHSVAHLP